MQHRLKQILNTTTSGFLFAILSYLPIKTWALEIDLTQIKPQASIEFLATGAPSFIKIKGTGALSNGTLDTKENKASFDVDLKSFTTGISLRDDHMHKALESEQFPKAKLVITLDPNKIKSLSKDQEQDFNGVLSLHGQDKPISGKMKLIDESKIEANLKILLSEFNIKAPEYLGAKVKDEVAVKAEVTLK